MSVLYIASSDHTFSAVIECLHCLLLGVTTHLVRELNVCTVYCPV